MSSADCFSSNYAEARQRFRDAASSLGWTLEEIPIAPRGPQNEPLTIDVASSSEHPDADTLVLSSGLHGVEGYFGSAVQLSLLEKWQREPTPVRCLFFHGLNPYGFAWNRRFDADNIDPNRNFLLPGDEFAGCPEGYAQLDRFLNPKSPPSSLEPFTLKAMLLIARHGLPALQQAVAGGQFDFPQGLFFGGDGPSETNAILSENMPRWICGAQQVVHLDFHTGLGPRATHKLLIDYPLTEAQVDQLTTWFGPDRFERSDSAQTAYDARGGFGRWCSKQGLASNYLFACAEFGTYGPVQVLQGLRAENRAHHWGQADSSSTQRAKERLRELFCPKDPQWRETTVRDAVNLVDRAIEGMLA